MARSRTGRLVAIKTVARARAETAASFAAFAHEASVCVRLRHPCIVEVRAFLEEPGFAALVFDYVPGVALARVLRVCSVSGVRLPDLAAWHIVERVLTALAYAHEFRDAAGQRTPIVHRDVSPSNVLLDWAGGVKIADFGIAKVLGVSPTTRTGLVKGTLGCMAPEQARGEPVDERADVYAAGLLAWRLLTGRAPFSKHQSDEFELLRAMRSPRLKPLASIRPDIPDPLVDAFARALIPDRDLRTISAAELVEVVRAHIDLRPGQSELGSLLTRWKPELERTVRRVTDSVPEPPPSARDRIEMTARYEEVALAFDDDPGPDALTLQAHALPSEGPVRADLSSDWPLPIEAAARFPVQSPGIRRGWRIAAPLELPRGWTFAAMVTIALLGTLGLAWFMAR